MPLKHKMTILCSQLEGKHNLWQHFIFWKNFDLKWDVHDFGTFEMPFKSTIITLINSYHSLWN